MSGVSYGISTLSGTGVACSPACSKRMRRKKMANAAQKNDISIAGSIMLNLYGHASRSSQFPMPQ